jgi:hypothetical protein
MRTIGSLCESKPPSHSKDGDGDATSLDPIAPTRQRLLDDVAQKSPIAFWCIEIGTRQDARKLRLHESRIDVARRILVSR